jgi:hypothetical protein
MIDWLKKRLVPAKGDTSRWSELAEACQTFWETYFDPYAQRLLDLRSIYTAWADDLETIMAELGDYFRADIGESIDRPIQIVWRRLELQGKETESLVHMTLRRKFLGLDIEWVPLYHEKTAEYGTAFKKLEEIEFAGLDVADYFLTSHGKIQLASKSLDQQNLSFADFLAAVTEEIERFLPTHIVYDGAELTSDELSAPLYFGGFVVEGVTTGIEMDVFVY